MIRSVLTLFCFLLVSWSVHAQITVSAALDTSEILIGDQVLLHLKAEYPAHYPLKDVDLSALDSIYSSTNIANENQEPSKLELLHQTDWETIEQAGIITYQKDIRLIGWDEGIYFIPQFRFEFENKGTLISRATNRLNLIVSSPIETNSSPDSINIAPIKDIIKEEWRLSDFLPVLYLIGAILLIVLGLISLMVYIIRKKHGPPPIHIVKRPAHEIAFHKLNQLKEAELWQKGEVKNYQSELNYIVREYIENRYNTPALESTSSEILSDLKKVDFPSNLEEKLREMLQLADMVKFAKATPPEEMHQRLMDFATEIIENTKQELSAEDQEKLEMVSPGVEDTFMLNTQYASSGKRLLAYVVDSFIFHASILLLFFIIYLIFQNNIASLLNFTSVLIFVLVYFTLGFFYFAYMHAKQKQTAGKKLIGIELINTTGKNISMRKAMLRFFIKTLSSLFFFLPFLPIFFNIQKQGLHDMVANTVVVNKSRKK